MRALRIILTFAAGLAIAAMLALLHRGAMVDAQPANDFPASPAGFIGQEIPRMYDVDDLVAQQAAIAATTQPVQEKSSRAQRRRDALEYLMQVIQDQMKSDIYKWDDSATFHPWGDQILVAYAVPSDQQQIAQTLEKMRHPDAVPSRAQGAMSQAQTIPSKLDVVVPDVYLTKTPLATAFERLGKLTGVNITLDWPALEAASIKRDSTVNVFMHDFTLEQAISVAVNCAHPDVKLSLTWENGGLRVSTVGSMETRVYDLTNVLKRTDTYDLLNLLHRELPGPTAEDTNGDIRYDDTHAIITTKFSMRLWETGILDVLPGSIYGNSFTDDFPLQSAHVFGDKLIIVTTTADIHRQIIDILQTAGN